MSRFVSVWLPHLPIERLKRERAASGVPLPPDDRPFALVGSDARGLTLTAVNAASARDGLLPGLGSPMPAPSARSFSPRPPHPTRMPTRCSRSPAGRPAIARPSMWTATTGCGSTSPACPSLRRRKRAPRRSCATAGAGWPHRAARARRDLRRRACARPLRAPLAVHRP